MTFVTSTKNIMVVKINIRLIITWHIYIYNIYIYIYIISEIVCMLVVEADFGVFL